MIKSIIPILLLSLSGLLHAETQVPAEQAAPKKKMICPVNATEGCDGSYCLKEVNGDISVEHEGRKVFFCCKMCAEAFSKAPKPYLPKVKEQWQVIDAAKKP